MRVIYGPLLTLALILIVPAPCCGLWDLHAQEHERGPRTQSHLQPTVMVIPFTVEGEDIRTVLENDVNMRIAITKTKDAFDRHGLTTVDFVARLRTANDNDIFTSDNQTDIRAQIIQMSGCDVYVQLELDVQHDEPFRSVTLILTAYDAATGNTLASKVGQSGRFESDDVGRMAERAVARVIDDFVATLNGKFAAVLAEGRPVVVDISVAEFAGYDLSTEFGADQLPLADVLELWFADNAHNGFYHIQGTTSLKMILDEVRIPLRDPVTGRDFNPNRFALALYQYARSLGIAPRKDVKGNTIYLTLN